ncbi:MAG: DNA polymerase III subunit beta [Bulleidia sp.]
MSEMNFQISRDKFYNALTIASRAISSNSPVPALTGILITAMDKQLLLTASNAVISIQMTLSNEKDPDLGLSISGEGSIVIESRFLMDIVKKIDSDQIKIEIIDGTLTHFEGNKAEYKINCIRPDDYPSIDFSEPAVKFEINSGTLNEFITQTVFAAAVKETRPVLTGVNFNSNGKEIICTGTDSYRLSRRTAPITSDPFMITVPSKTLNEVKNIFAEDQTIKVALNDKKIQFSNDKVMLQSTLLEGDFPDTNRLIPKDFTRTMVINKTVLLDALDRAAFIKTDNISTMYLQMTGADDISLSNRSQEIGEFHEVLNAVSYEGDPLDISFSGQYMMDALRIFKGENVKISFTGVMKPFIITEEEDSSVIELILPVRTYM